MNSTPTFSVVIPTCDRNDLLAKCLDRLAPDIQSFQMDNYEVIVTDDGRGITAEQMIQEKYSWARWVCGPKKGPAANRNNGARYARGEWLAFTDDDCIPDAEWLNAYLIAIDQYPSCLIFEGRTYADRKKISLAEIAPINETGGYLWSCNFLIKRELFEQMGGFDEQFPYAAMEDVDFRSRIIKAGQYFLFIKDAAVCHPWRLREGWEKLKQHQESAFIYLSIHQDELSKLNSKYYVRSVLNGLIRSTIPEGIRFKGRGVKESLLEHLSSLEMALFLFVNYNPYKKAQR
jgi:GT2 family glycosyltransferase